MHRVLGSLAALFMLTTTAHAEDRYFPYPATTQLRQLDPAISRMSIVKDIVIDPGQTSLFIINESNHRDDEDTSNVCRLDFAAASSYRRILARTGFALTAVTAGGDSSSAAAGKAAYVQAVFTSDGGFQMTLNCSSTDSWQSYNEQSQTWEYGESSNNYHSVSDVGSQLALFRRETIVTAQ